MDQLDTNANSKKKDPAGLLIMAANSLGLAEDIPTRALRALRESDLVIFEEDKVARQTLKAAGIHREYLKYTEHEESETLGELRAYLKSGKTVIYMSDQGSPCLADPGAALAKVAFECKASMQVIPGPSSVTAALSACPFPIERFTYVGFLPRKPELRTKELNKVKLSKDPIVILDTPYRMEHLLTAVAATFGTKRKGLLAIDISGGEESYHYGRLAELAPLSSPSKQKKNFVLVVEGP